MSTKSEPDATQSKTKRPPMLLVASPIPLIYSSGKIIPVEITVYADRSFTFITKTPPASSLLLEYAGLKSGSGEPNREKVGTVTKSQIKEIAEMKMPDLNAASIESAMSMIEGTARSMGLLVE